MRVLQVTTDNDRRGAQIFAGDLHTGLADLGCDVETVALAPGRVGGLDFPPLGSRRRSLRTITALRSRSRHADVVIAHGSTALPVTALAMLGSRTPFVYRQVSDSLFWAPSASRRLRVRMAMSRAEKIVALWDGAAEILATRFSVPSEKLHVIPNGVRGSSWTPPSEAERHRAKSELRLPLDLPVVAFAAAFTPEKGPDLAIETVASIAEAHLLMVGAGPEDAQVRALADRLLEGRVTFVGSTSDIRKVYSATDVLLFPSRGGDSMPAVVIEAGMMGIPAVATNTGALSSMLESGKTGQVVPTPTSSELASATRTLLHDPERRRAIGSAARAAFLRSFDMEVVSARWLSVLDAVMVPTSASSAQTVVESQ